MSFLFRVKFSNYPAPRGTYKTSPTQYARASCTTMPGQQVEGAAWGASPEARPDLGRSGEPCLQPHTHSRDISPSSTATNASSSAAPAASRHSGGGKIRRKHFTTQHMLASCVDGLHPPWRAQRSEVLSAPAVTEVSTGHEGVAQAGWRGEVGREGEWTV